MKVVLKRDNVYTVVTFFICTFFHADLFNEVSFLLLVSTDFVVDYFRPLRCGKTKVHQNLMTSFVLNGLCQISWLRLQSSESVLQENPVRG